MQVGDKLVITYETGYSDEDAIRSRENMSQSEWEEFYSRMKDTYKTRYQILDLEGKKLSDTEIQEELSDLFANLKGSTMFLCKAVVDVAEVYITSYQFAIG